MSAPSPPYRQIRAHHTPTTITVYQAYSRAIAHPAISEQRLDASPAFLPQRMTWIKPSWCWMLYRSGYGYKDDNQAVILALTLPRGVWEGLLARSSLSHGGKGEGKGEGKAEVRVQWDPERDVGLVKLPWRSIQVGVGRGVVGEFVDGILGIEDVTGRARETARLVEEGRVEEARALVPEEREYVLSEELRKVLGMDVGEDQSGTV